MTFSLSGLVQKATSLISSREGSVVGIDIGASAVKVVQLRSSHGVAVLETYGEIALAPYAKMSIGKVVKLTPEQTAAALLDLIKEANVTASTGGISIPFASSLISILDLPKIDDKQLARMIPIEARKYIPVPVDEVTLDWFVIPQDEEQDAFDRVEQKTPLHAVGQEVLLVAIHNDTIKNYQTIAQTANITIDFFEIEIFSTVRSSLSHGIAPVLVVDFGAATTKMYIVERGVVRLSHLMTSGGQHMTETMSHALNWDFEKAERIKREQGLIASTAYSPDENEKVKTALLSTLSRMFSEINRVLLSYGQRYNKHVSHVVLTGGGASLPGLIEAAHESLSVEVEIAAPFSRTESPAFLDEVLREIGPGFAVSLGLALRNLKR